MFFIAFNYYCYIYKKNSLFYFILLPPPFTSFCLLFISPFCVCTRNPWAASKPPPIFSPLPFAFWLFAPSIKHWGSCGHCMLMRAPHLWAPYLWGGMGSSPKATQSPLGQPSCCPALTAWLMAALPREAVPCLPPDELRAFGKGDPCAFSSLCSRGEC